MAVLRIVPNLPCDDPEAVAAFWARLFDLRTPMVMDFIATCEGSGAQPPQVKLASEGGSGTPLPAVSVEVDDLDAALTRAAEMGIAPEYGPVDEPWGVRRFYLRDPAGTLVNVLTHHRDRIPDRPT